MTLLDDLDRRRERAARDLENSARLAQAYAVFKSEGQGTTQHNKRIDFGLTFVEKPMVSYGAEVDTEELADSIGHPDPEEAPLPLSTGYVVEWDRDDRDFYVGCWIAARVYYPEATGEEGAEVDITAQPVIRHHFTFSGTGMKDIPPNQEDAVD